MNNPDIFIHPLSESRTIIDPEGKEHDVINTWGLASMLWGAYLDRNKNAISVIEEVFDGNKDELNQLTKMCRSKNKNIAEAANYQVINKINAKIEEKVEVAFADE